MKFTKEEFSEKLKDKLTNKGKKPMQQSERTFKKLVEKIYARLEKRDDDETELDDAVADYLEDFEEIEGNLNKDKADFIRDWKDKHPDPKPNDPPTPPAPPSNDDKFDKLMKKFEELEKREAEREKSENIAKLRKELKAKLKKEGVDDAEWLDGYLKKLTITEETDIDEEKEDALKLYNKANSTTNQFTPGNPAGKGGEVDLSYLKKGKK
jgi:hypothetical protein